MSKDNAANNMTTKVEDRDLVLERIFDAPRELVFKVFKERWISVPVVCGTIACDRPMAR